MIVQDNILSKEECDLVLELANHHEFKKSRAVYSNKFDEQVDENYRTSLEIQIPTPQIIEDILKPKLIKYNINSLPNRISILKYTKGKEFKRHVDNIEPYRYRLKTFSIQLSDKDEYSGGDFLIYENKDTEILFDKTIGNMVLFDSDRAHLVTPILSGTRYALVMWFTEHNLDNKNNLI